MKTDNTTRVQVPPTDRIPPSGSAESTTVMTRVGEPLLDTLQNERLFDQYTIYSKIGGGGMGVVYLARDRRLGRFVAIKRLNHQAQTNPSLRQRFLQEARAVAALSHVHIIHIYALGEDDDGPYIVMEYIAGPDSAKIHADQQESGLVKPNNPLTLDQYINERGQLAMDDAVALMIKISRAVAYAHSCGVIHRDLKPSNILLDKTSEPKIVDFGLARLRQPSEDQLTVPGEKLLSLGYGAPEQESDASMTDERSDVYGLGAVLYFVLTGQNPRYFREQDIPIQLREVLVKALATDKELRWPSAHAFSEALMQVQNKTRIEVPTVKTTWRCKWCDAVNPLATKFCAECGWDGSESCPECGGETFVGVQYCSNCGADARSYETILILLKKMREAIAQCRFERVILYTGRLHGFEPAGPSGRAYLNEITALREEAEKKISKRDQLKEQIPLDIRVENFERALHFIKQLRELSEDKHAFEMEEKQFPEKILARDLQRARNALRHREWDNADRICEELQKNVAPNDPDCHHIRMVVQHVRKIQRVWVIASWCGGLIFAYLLSLPLVAGKTAVHGMNSVARFIYTPAIACYDSGIGRATLQPYARLFITGGIVRNDTRAANTGPQALIPTAPTAEPMYSDELTRLRLEFERSTAENTRAAELRVNQWADKYVAGLTELMDYFQRAGDYEGWESVRKEAIRFGTERTISMRNILKTPQEINTMQQTFLQQREDLRANNLEIQRTAIERYTTQLRALQKALTVAGKMATAASVQDEINRVSPQPPTPREEQPPVDPKDAQSVIDDLANPPSSSQPTN